MRGWNYTVPVCISTTDRTERCAYMRICVLTYGHVQHTAGWRWQIFKEGKHLCYLDKGECTTVGGSELSHSSRLHIQGFFCDECGGSVLFDVTPSRLTVGKPVCRCCWHCTEAHSGSEVFWQSDTQYCYNEPQLWWICREKKGLERGEQVSMEVYLKIKMWKSKCYKPKNEKII